jgi:type IV pilus assembly protein PilV
MKNTFVHRRLRRPRRSGQGIALIEALVALLLFAFGVLGIVGLQTSMTRAQSSAKFRGDASYLASELLGTMWSDIPNLAQYDTASARCDAYARCLAWKTKVQSAMPGQVPEVAADATGAVTITIHWAVPGEGAHQYVTSSSVQAVQ